MADSADARPLDGARTGDATPRISVSSAEAAAKLDHFAELLSLDIPIPLIAERMGMRRGSAYALLDRIRRGLGPQAA